jgi:hypothetical protein
MIAKLALLIGLLALSFNACLAGIGKIEGYFSAKAFLTSTNCLDSDVGGYVLGSYGNCVKIFGGPQDPSTSLTSYKITNVNNQNQNGVNTIVFTKQFYSDGSCDVANGTATTNSIEVGKCEPSKETTSSSFEYSNTTLSITSSPVAGLSVSGYQEYNYCSMKSRTSYQYIYPNNYCYVQSGRTKAGANYKVWYTRNFRS